MADLRGEATDLIHSYAHCVDSFDMVAFEALFVQDAQIIGIDSDPLTPRALVERLQSSPFMQSREVGRHLMSNLVFTSLTEIAAAGRAYVTYYQVIDPVPMLKASGVYHFELARTDERWRISRWTVDMDVDKQE